MGASIQDGQDGGDFTTENTERNREEGPGLADREGGEMGGGRAALEMIGVTPLRFLKGPLYDRRERVHYSPFMPISAAPGHGRMEE